MDVSRRFHIAIGVTDVESSVDDYSSRLGRRPEVVVPGEYALWRSDVVNFSIRRAPGAPGMLRHLGWEDPGTDVFSQDVDTNGIVWELFNAAQQLAEIDRTWPRP